MHNAVFSFLGDGGEYPVLAESLFIPLHQEKFPHQIFVH